MSSIHALTALVLSPALLAAGLVTALLAVCPAETPTELASGTYAGADSGHVALNIDDLTFSGVDARGQAFEGNLVPAGRDFQVEACPTIEGSTTVTAYFLDVDQLRLGGRVIEHPVVSSRCGDGVILWDRDLTRDSRRDVPASHVALSAQAAAPYPDLAPIARLSAALPPAEPEGSAV